MGNKRAFTLIEILIYSSILAIASGVIFGILNSVLRVQTQQSASAEVTSQLNFALQTIGRLVNESSNIDMATSTATSTLKLRMRNSAVDPTCVSLSGGVMTLAQGPSPSDTSRCKTDVISITNDKVVVNALQFTRVARAPGRDTVSVDITMSFNTENPQAQETRSISSAIARASAAVFDSNLLPGADNMYSVGFNPSTRWRDAAFSGTVTVGGNVGIGTTGPAERLEVVGDIRVETPNNSGDILFTDGTAYGLNRHSGQISLLGSIKGRLVNHNPDFSQGTGGYHVYNNSGGTAVTHSIVTDATSPSNSGRVLRISYSPGPVSPGFGGFHIGIPRCAAGAAGGACYIEGNRYVHRIWARIPVGRSINFATNAYGTGGSHRWISSQDGTGNWEQYIAVQTIGIGGTFSTTGFWFISGGTDTTFTWDVALLEFIGVDEPSTTDLAKSLNVGFRQDTPIDTGQLLTTRDAFLAVTSGNVGIGTAAPGARLDVVGRARMTEFQLGTAATAGHVLTTNAAGVGTWQAAAGVTWPLQSTIDGTAAAPAYSWVANTNMGIRRGGVDDLRFVTAGTDRMTINAAGNVGIGTTAPGVRLDVAGQIRYGVSQTVSGATSVTFSGLNGDIDRIYQITMIGRFATAAANRNVRLGPNNNFSTAGFRNAVNRHWEVAGVVGHNIEIRNNGGITMGFTDWNADGDILIEGTLNAATGRARAYQGAHTYFNSAAGADRQLQGQHAGWWNDSTTNITSLVIDFNGGTFTGTVILRTISW